VKLKFKLKFPTNMSANQSSSNVSLKNLVIGEKYKLLERIGRGSYGEIYRGENIENKTKVAIKVEDATSKSIHREISVYKRLNNKNGFPNLLYYTKENSKMFLVMDLLGKNLTQHFIKCSGQFTLKTVIMLAEQMIARIKTLHSKGYIHRDIKPENFVMGLEPASDKVFLIDFGFCKQYKNLYTQKHIPFKQNIMFAGNLSFSSLNAALEVQPSRRDDLESIGLVLLYFVRPLLPWSKIRCDSIEQRFDAVLEIKKSISIKKLCEGLPNGFRYYFDYCRKLKFEETPDYDYLISLFHQMARDSKIKLDGEFDWLKLQQQKDQNNKKTKTKI